MKQISVNPNLQTYSHVLQKGELLPFPLKQVHADNPVPWLKYRVSCLAQHTRNYLPAARHLTFGVLALWATAASAKLCAMLQSPLQGGSSDAPCTHPWRWGWDLHQAACFKSATANTQCWRGRELRGPEKQLNWWARTSKHRHVQEQTTWTAAPPVSTSQHPQLLISLAKWLL